jgi:hypothetical protein
MLKYLILFLIASICSLFLTPILRSVSRKVGVLDLPGEKEVYAQRREGRQSIQSKLLSRFLRKVRKLKQATFDQNFINLGLLGRGSKKVESLSFGDGKASERIVNILLGRPYEPFQSDIKLKGRI